MGTLSDKRLVELYDELYNQQKEISDGHLDEFFLERNKKLLEQVDSFINESLKSGYAFDSLQSGRIHCAAAMLGPQEQELQAMVDSIDKHITKKKRVKVLRLTSDICKRAELKHLIEDVGKTNRCCVIVEYTESLMKHQLEENFIGSLYKLLKSDDVDRRIMILFCLLSDATNIDEIYFSVDTSMLKTYPNIDKEPIKESESTIKSKLMSMEGMNFELAPSVIEHLSRNFMEVDPSSMELKYLHDFCLSDFYSKPECLVHLPDQKLRECLETQPLKGSLKNLPSLQKNQIKSSIPWTDPAKLSKFIRKILDNLRSSHVHLMKQIKHYADILVDTTGQKFPEDHIEIYKELVSPHRDSLAQSERMCEAINGIINGVNQKTLMARIESTLNSNENGCRSPLKSKKSEDIHQILSKYLKILENNENSKKTVISLANDLVSHLVNLKNPLKQPFNELFYYNDIKQIMSHTIPIVRYSILREKNDGSYYDILNSLVMQEGEVISIQDLFENFKDKLKDEDDDDMVKSIFIDKIETMVHQGVIKIINQGKKKGFAKRVAWL